ncbi:hypothetical protein [Pedobacter psychrodurus]|uniref:hypothetical protein n=1 Tax=Pedobacter psychrodurus TaxID=2530456 RepID=UPI002931ADC0|nr:hypothetical protein [Pedobacter psychrodurus]
MASLINVFIPLEIFLKEFDSLLASSGMHVYVEKKVGKKSVLQNFKQGEALPTSATKGHPEVYITSEAFDPEKYASIYDDGFCIHAIVLLGGRSTPGELENLSLRVISKTPDKVIKYFFNKLNKYLKGSGDYGIGVGEGMLYSKTFYHLKEVKGKTLWFDFDRKFGSVLIGAS